MKKLAIIALLIAMLLIGIVVGQVVREYVFPTTGEIISISLSIKWLNGTDVTTIDWGPTENSTAYVMEPFNITNISNVPVNLTLSTSNESASIISLSLTWNYTGNPLAINESVIVELYQNCTATGPYSYTTIIRGIES